MADQPTITIAVPKPLPCRLAALLKDWKDTRDNMKKRGEEEAAMAVEVCAEMLYGEVTAFFNEVKAWREVKAGQEHNDNLDRTDAAEATHR